MTPTYQVKNTESGTYQTIETKFAGVKVLSIDGFLDRGKPVNIYTAQWVNSQTEDFMITTINNQNNPVVIRENSDLSITFCIRQKYTTTTIDVMTVHDTFVNYMTGSDIWVKSSYVGNKYVHCVCLKEYKPTTVKLHRGSNSYILGTIELHCLEAPTTDVS